ncbi:tRNA lysidine(34) synthetase TilS [Entomobacter blattae]|uniref:tRNA(Ile)-lysidine synthase n=1 Tax=Entomobacter blattae TaxID=2762277 RepID=A0A7H1NTD4_9PROT|nr:tRNA lysidine(34) synthetase TilS [Entomobacter blattae]QNT79044.1 tRNA(Ile)-lysidine synthase [Entomobacter blattae]
MLALSNKEFFTLIEPLGPWGEDKETGAPIMVAVSGGADSLALAFLCRQWRKNVMGLTVDHGLRSTSAEEASLTKKRLAAFGMPCEIITLSSLFPGSSLAERARTARYEVLVQSCIRYGAVDLLVAHHASDQAETVALREQANSDRAGLAGMALIRETAPVRIVRPLLDVPAERLKQRLIEENLSWVEDPSNKDLKSRRVQVRYNLGKNKTLGKESYLLLRKARTAGQERMENEKVRARILSTQGGTLYSEGYGFIPEGFADIYSLRELLRVIGGKRYAPSLKSVSALLPLREATLSGVRIVKSRKKNQHGWFLLRELSAIQDVHHLLARESQSALPFLPFLQWDNRFAVYLPNEVFGQGLILKKLGEEAARFKFFYGRKNKRLPYPMAVLRALPALFTAQDELVGIPNLIYDNCKTFLHFQIYFQTHQPVLKGEKFIHP